MKSTQHSFGPCGLCYELGLSELCLSRDDSVNYSLFRSYGSAICKVLTAPNDEYMNIFENHTGATYNVDDSQDMSIANTIGRKTIYFPIFYGSLLHLLFIRSDKKNRGQGSNRIIQAALRMGTKRTWVCLGLPNSPSSVPACRQRRYRRQETIPRKDETSDKARSSAN